MPTEKDIRHNKILGIALSQILNGAFIDNQYNYRSLEDIAEDEDIRKRLANKVLEEAAQTLDKLETDGVEFITCDSPQYPYCLRELPEKPVGLYIRSNTKAKDLFGRGVFAVAVTGTRIPSPYGIEATRKIINTVKELYSSCTIISGLAFGVDCHAHRAALENGLKTIAVLPCGIDTVYPLTNRKLAEEIIDAGGALISQFHPKTAPIPISFILRNRLIAGLADDVFVTETKKKGGAIVTAMLARDYDKNVFAVPGRIDDIRSAGCNKLIKDGTAEIWLPIEQ